MVRVGGGGGGRWALGAHALQNFMRGISTPTNSYSDGHHKDSDVCDCVINEEATGPSQLLKS